MGKRGEENTETDVAAKTGHSMVADMQTSQPFMHKFQVLEANSGSLPHYHTHTHTLAANPLMVTVAVRNVSTHLAMNRKRKISICCFKTSKTSGQVHLKSKIQES